MPFRAFACAPELTVDVVTLRAYFWPDFDDVEDSYIERAIATAELEYALADDPLLWLAAHNITLYLTDPAAVDHGAGVVAESGTGELRTTLETGAVSPADVRYLRSKYGRQYLILRRAAVALPW